MNNEDLFNLVKTGSPLTGTLALTLLNQRTSGAILSVVSELIEQPNVKDTGGKIHAE